MQRSIKHTRDTYRDGKHIDGWGCTDCPKTFIHGGKRARTFAAVLLHKAIAHRAFLLKESPGVQHVTTWTSLAPVADRPSTFPPAA